MATAGMSSRSTATVCQKFAPVHRAAFSSSVNAAVNLVTPPISPEADVGMIVIESDYYPPMSGSNLMCTVTAVLETGMLPMTENSANLVLFKEEESWFTGAAAEGTSEAFPQREIDPKQIKSLARWTMTRSYGAGQTIVSEGQIGMGRR